VLSSLPISDHQHCNSEKNKFVALGREDEMIALCHFEAAAICCAALQPLKIK
jgi:hypothetical protein